MTKEQETRDPLPGRLDCGANREAIARVIWMQFCPGMAASDEDKKRYLECADAILAETALPPTLNSGADSYRDVIDEALVVRHLGIAKGNPSDELNTILSWEVGVALDPRVSSDAQALIDKGAALPGAVEGGANIEGILADCLSIEQFPWKDEHNRPASKLRIIGIHEAANKIRALSHPNTGDGK